MKHMQKKDNSVERVDTMDRCMPPTHGTPLTPPSKTLLPLTLGGLKNCLYLLRSYNGRKEAAFTGIALEVADYGRGRESIPDVEREIRACSGCRWPECISSNYHF